MAALIGALRVSLSADTAQFEQGMRRAQATAATTSSGIQKSLGLLKAGVAGLVSGLSVGMFASVIKGALDYAGSLGEVAQQLGVTTRDLQVFRFAAGQVGVSQAQLETGLSKLTITLGKVAAGAKQPIAALDAIGISVDQLKGKDTGEAFRIIADGLQKVTDRSQRAAVEVAIFGKSGAQLDNLLSGGSAAINELSLAAEKLGIVLSDDQIQKADDTADKLEALKTVLSARIAGVVADNADSIYGFADSLVYLVGKIGEAMEWLQRFRNFLSEQTQLYSIPAQIKRAAGIPVNATGLGQIAQNGGSVTLKLPPARPATPSPPPSGNIKQFLAGGGGGKKKSSGGGRADHSAEDALRDEYQFAEQSRRAEMDILRAKQDLATDYHGRNQLSIQMLDLEHESNEAEMQYQVELFKLTSGKQGMSQVQADQLRISYDIKDGLERQKIAIDDENERRKRAFELSQNDFDRRKEILDSQSAIARTAAERRKIELEILQITYDQKRQALQHVLDTSMDANEIANARRDLATLDATEGNDRQNVIQQTRGPFEEWAASIPHTADEITEAFQQIQVEGLEGLAGAMTEVISGTKSLKDAFADLAKSVIAQILQMTIRMMIFRALSSALGGLGGIAKPASFGASFTGDFASMGSGTLSTPFPQLPGFAAGGSMRVLGRGGTDRNVLSLNGLPIARVSHGERVNISNDNVNDGQAKVMIVPSPYFDAHVQGQAATVAAPMAGQAAIMGASGAMTGISRQRSRTIP